MFAETRPAVLPSSRRRQRAVALAFLLLLLSGSRVGAFPIPPKLAELAKRSDRIVVAKVESIRGLPIVGKQWARAKVTEVWKGPATETVEYLISGLSCCDVSDAKRGETVLLFLTKEEEIGWVIANQGRGRMPLRSLKDKQCAMYYDVVFPKGTRILKVSGDEDFDVAVELATVRDLVDKALGDKKAVPHEE